jgi:hypothetical protein
MIALHPERRYITLGCIHILIQILVSIAFCRPATWFIAEQRSGIQQQTDKSRESLCYVFQVCTDAQLALCYVLNCDLQACNLIHC